jgi:hypothetical protein
MRAGKRLKKRPPAQDADGGCDDEVARGTDRHDATPWDQDARDPRRTNETRRAAASMTLRIRLDMPCGQGSRGDTMGGFAEGASTGG